MPYRYLPDIATADVAFEATAETLEELFQSAADATMNVMVGDLASIARPELRIIRVRDSELDMLLFQLLQELIFFKDAEKLLLRVGDVEIRRCDEEYELIAEARGEEIDPARHDLVVDVKAVTLHRFRVEHKGNGWIALVILDI